MLEDPANRSRKAFACRSRCSTPKPDVQHSPSSLPPAYLVNVYGHAPARTQETMCSHTLRALLGNLFPVRGKPRELTAPSLLLCDVLRLRHPLGQHVNRQLGLALVQAQLNLALS